MKKATREEFEQDPRRMIESCQGEQILITSEGQPIALLTGVSNKDEEDLALERSPEFWRMIEERRRQTAVPLRDVENEILSAQAPDVEG